MTKVLTAIAVTSFACLGVAAWLVWEVDRMFKH